MGLIEKGGSLILSAFLAVTGSGGSVVAENNGETNDASLKIPDPIIIEGEMPSQKELVIENQIEKETNQIFDEYLTEQEEYSDEKIINESFDTTLGYKRDLGFIGNSTYSFSVQAMLLASFDYENQNFLAIGVKDKKGKRKITIVEYPINEKIKAFSAVHVDCLIGNRHEDEAFESREKAMSFLDDKLGKMIEIRFYNLDKDGLRSEMYKDSSSEGVSFYLDTAIPRQMTNIDYAAGLLTPPKDKLSVEEKKFVKSLDKNSKLNEVENYQEVLEILKSGKDIPLISGITYRKFK